MIRKHLLKTALVIFVLSLTGCGTGDISDILENRTSSQTDTTGETTEETSEYTVTTTEEPTTTEKLSTAEEPTTTEEASTVEEPESGGGSVRTTAREAYYTFLKELLDEADDITENYAGYTDQGTYYQAFAIEDFDSDGVEELLVEKNYGYIFYRYNSSSGQMDMLNDELSISFYDFYSNGVLGADDCCFGGINADYLEAVGISTEGMTDPSNTIQLVAEGSYCLWEFADKGRKVRDLSEAEWQDMFDRLTGGTLIYPDIFKFNENNIEDVNSGGLDSRQGDYNYTDSVIPKTNSTDSGTSDSDSGDTTSTDGYILPTSNSAYLTKSDLSGLSKDGLMYARNEIYARHGRMFKDEEIQAYFNSCSWYSGTVSPDDFDESVFNEYEKANLDLIIEYEEDMGYR